MVGDSEKVGWPEGIPKTFGRRRVCVLTLGHLAVDVCALPRGSW